MEVRRDLGRSKEEDLPPVPGFPLTAPQQNRTNVVIRYSLSTRRD